MHRYASEFLRNAMVIVATATVSQAPKPAEAQATVINFDTAANWTQGASSLTSYAANHAYADGGWSFTGGPALRNTTATQDGVAGALGTYAWRMNTGTAISWTATYTTGGTLTDFGFDVRRWDSTPSPNMLVEYSVNGGSSYTSTGTTINNTSLDNASAWKTFAFTLPSMATVAASQFIVRLTQPSSPAAERVMLDNFSFTTGPDGESNSSVLSLPGSSSFGRVMTNGSASVQLSTTGTATTWAASATGGFTPTSSGSIAGDGSTTIAIGVGSALGSRSGTLSVDNTATTSAAAGQGSDQADIASSLTATVVQNRQLGLTAAPGVGVTDNVITVGKVLVGTMATGTGTLTTSGADAENTRVTLAASQNVDFTSGTDPRTGGTGIYARLTTPATAVVFNDANVTATVSGEVAYGTSGLKTTNYAGLSSSNALAGEGLTGESVRSGRVYYSADVYQAASVAKGAGQSGPIGNGGTVSITNAAVSDGGQRAAAAIASKTLAGDSGWSVGGLTVGTQIAAGGTASTTASFDATARLNGTYLAELMVGLEHADQTIAGTAANDLGSLVWELSHHVTGRNGGGTADVKSGQSYASFHTSRGSGRNSSVSFAAGTARSTKTVSIGFSDAPTTGGTFVSDVLQLEGTGSDPVVLELGYDPTGLSLATEMLLTLNWLDTRAGSLTNGEWILSVVGNDYTAGGSTAGSSFLGSWANYAASNPGATATNSLGRYGVDTESNKVWAVINHNSEFVVAVPEPSALGLVAAGLVLTGLGTRKRRRTDATAQASGPIAEPDPRGSSSTTPQPRHSRARA